MARCARSMSPNTSQREGKAEARGWKTPAVIAAVIAALVAMSVALINQRTASKPNSSDIPHITQATHGRDSPAIAHVQGDVNVTYGISKEQYDQLREEFGVTKAALRSFFTIVEQQQVPREDLDTTLRDIAKKYKTLQEHLRTFTSDDPTVVALKQSASKALEGGDFAQAETLLNEASQKDIEGAQQFQAMATKRLLSAAASKAELGALKDTQLRYAEAVLYYRQAVELIESIPKGSEVILATYLNRWAVVSMHVGDYASAEPRYQRALAIREQVLGLDHPDVAESLNDLAALYQTQGRYTEAEPLYRRALAVLEQALGPDHPDVALCLGNYAMLLRATNRVPEADELEIRAKTIRAKYAPK
jgi:tetratricopeptide (TPR) repeat protein